MNKTILACLALALVALPAYTRATSQPSTQSRCSLTETTAPKVRDVRLGMSTEQLLALFPASIKRQEVKEAIEQTKDPKNSDAVSIVFDPALDAGKGQFAEVASVSASIYKGRVIDFGVQYVGTTWNNIDEWIGTLSTNFNLPGAQAWAVGPSENPNKVLRCNEIEIEGAIQGEGGSIRVRNTMLIKEAERVRAEKEKKRAGFKP